MNTLGSLDDVTEANQAKLNLMYAHSSNPALRGSRTLFASRNKTETYEALGIISIMTLIALFGYKALNRKKNA